MPKPTLHFAHANGFPAGSYKQLFAQLESDFNIIALEKMGHNPIYPINDNWSNLAQELVAYLEQHATEPVIGVGHSMGGMATFLAAYERPELFKQLIIIDPPLAMGYGSIAFYLAKKAGYIDKLTPAGKTQYRKTQWDSKQACFDNLQAKYLFEHFSEQSLWDYIDAATDTQADGSIELHYSVDAECTAFRTVPDNIEWLRKPLSVPATLVRCNSGVMKPYFAQRLAKRHKMDLKTVTGGHMLPLQEPGNIAGLIKKVVGRLSV